VRVVHQDRELADAVAGRDQAGQSDEFAGLPGADSIVPRGHGRERAGKVVVRQFGDVAEEAQSPHLSRASDEERTDRVPIGRRDRRDTRDGRAGKSRRIGREKCRS
jgi:hypothetical protein